MPPQRCMSRAVKLHLHSARQGILQHCGNKIMKTSVRNSRDSHGNHMACGTVGNLPASKSICGRAQTLPHQEAPSFIQLTRYQRCGRWILHLTSEGCLFPALARKFWIEECLKMHNRGSAIGRRTVCVRRRIPHYFEWQRWTEKNHTSTKVSH